MKSDLDRLSASDPLLNWEIRFQLHEVCIYDSSEVEREANPHAKWLPRLVPEHPGDNKE